MGGGDFGAFIKAAPLFAEQLRAQASLLEAQLADGRAFLLGAEPGLADFAAYHPRLVPARDPAGRGCARRVPGASASGRSASRRSATGKRSEIDAGGGARDRARPRARCPARA